MERDSDVVVVGGGVIGLAVAAALARAGRSVALLERNGRIGQGITSRNSEVIHAGLYYPKDSLKARCCVEGRELLYRRCETHRIPHRRLGKLVVATNAQELEVLENIRARARDNGVKDLQLLDGARAKRLEPELRAEGALLSPSTGIVDAMALCQSYAAEAEEQGSLLVFHTEVTGLERCRAGWCVEARGADAATSRILCGAVVNAAGLGGDALAEAAGLDLDARGYRLHLCKGDYFRLAPSAPLRVQRLVYPVPAGPGLGVHATLDLSGGIRFGPDAEYVDAERYDVDPAKAEGFARAIRRYLPRLESAWLSPDYAGLRPKLAAPGESFRDFVVEEESAAGLPGLVSCLGIESPGLTAAPAIARRVVELLRSL